MIERLSLFVIFISICLPHSVNAQGDDKAWLMAQINSLRGQLGLHAYVWNDQLAAAAQQQSEYMASTGHISHTQANGSTPASRAAANGYTGRFVSENIYGGGIAGAADAWNFWINSPAHYHGIAHTRNNEIGVGVATSDRGTYFTLVFGYQSNLSAPPAEAPAPSQNNEAPNQSAPPVRAAPPTKTFTPSPTIPTLTPTVTWTMTSTWTPSPTATEPPPTSTPLQLSTAAIIAAMASSTFESATATPEPTIGDPTQNTPQRELESEQTMFPWLWVGGTIGILGVGLIFIIYGMTKLNGEVNG
jgi:hypothetical protein